MPEAGIVQAVEPLLAAIPDNNPTAVTAESLTRLLRAAWAGDDPK
jgi:hypothetical protein